MDSLCGNDIEYGHNIEHKYLKRILEGIHINPKLKVAWDCGTGVTGNIIEELKKHLTNHNIIINSKIDGIFQVIILTLLTLLTYKS